MKVSNTPQRPKFPRPKRSKKKLWVFGGVVCLLLAFFILRPSGSEELPQKTPDPAITKLSTELQKKNSEKKEQATREDSLQQKESSTKVPANAPLENSFSTTSATDPKERIVREGEKKSGTVQKDAPFVMNLAGITAKEQHPEPAPEEQHAVVTLAEQKDSILAPSKQKSGQGTETVSPMAKKMHPSVNKNVALPRSLDTENQPPLFAAESTLWDQPFVGFSLDEISAVLSEKYKGISPKEWGEHLSGVTSTFVSKSSSPTVALTLDACGGKKGSGYDVGIINFLRAKKVPATLFVTSTWISAHRKEFKELSSDPLFEIAAHGATHKPLSVNKRSIYSIQGTASIKEVVTEVESNSRELHRLTTKRPKWFRSGTAYYDEVAVSIVKDLGLHIAGFSIAADEGATLPAKKVEKKILSAKNGDIIICHMNHPESGTREGLLAAIPQLLEKGYIFTTLSQAALEQ